MEFLEDWRSPAQQLHAEQKVNPQPVAPSKFKTFVEPSILNPKKRCLVVMVVTWKEIDDQGEWQLYVLQECLSTAKLHEEASSNQRAMAISFEFIGPEAAAASQLPCNDPKRGAFPSLEVLYSEDAISKLDGEIKSKVRKYIKNTAAQDANSTVFTFIENTRDDEESPYWFRGIREHGALLQGSIEVRIADDPRKLAIACVALNCRRKFPAGMNMFQANEIKSLNDGGGDWTRSLLDLDEQAARSRQNDSFMWLMFGSLVVSGTIAYNVYTGQQSAKEIKGLILKTTKSFTENEAARKKLSEEKRRADAVRTFKSASEADRFDSLVETLATKPFDPITYQKNRGGSRGLKAPSSPVELTSFKSAKLDNPFHI